MTHSAEKDADPLALDEAYWRGYEDGFAEAIARVRKAGLIPEGWDTSPGLGTDS